eukprot:12295764-Alexandrium_andersonii.AAC.1
MNRLSTVVIGPEGCWIVAAPPMQGTGYWCAIASVPGDEVDGADASNDHYFQAAGFKLAANPA